MTIKHLVISGGGPSGFVAYGVLKTLAKSVYYDITTIETIYVSSVGSIIGVIVSLGYDWDWLDDYFIKRPWNNILEIDPTHLLSTFNDKGLYGIEIFEKVMEPLLTAKNLSPKITLLEYYQYNNIELHIFTSNLNSNIPESIDMSYKTHPELVLVKAIYMSASFPFLFKPILDEGKCFIDGGLLNNYPLYNCIENIKSNNNGIVNKNEIVALKKTCSKYTMDINEKMNVIEYGVELFRKMHIAVLKENDDNNHDIKYTIDCVVSSETGLESWWNIFATEDGRKEVISDGEKIGDAFIAKHSKTA